MASGELDAGTVEPAMRSLRGHVEFCGDAGDGTGASVERCELSVGWPWLRSGRCLEAVAGDPVRRSRRDTSAAAARSTTVVPAASCAATQ